MARKTKRAQRNYFSTHGAVAGLMATERFLVALAENRAADMGWNPSSPHVTLWDLSYLTDLSNIDCHIININNIME